MVMQRERGRTAAMMAVAGLMAALAPLVPDGGATASAASAPLPPTITSWTAAPGGALVYFTPPTSDGGSPITNYETCDPLECATFAALVPPDTTSPLFIPIMGLPQGSVQLRAINEFGSSDRSNGVTVDVLPPVPWAPSGVTAKPGDRSAVLTFTAAAVDQGDPVTNHEYSLDGGASWVPLSPADATSPVTVRGLTNGTRYSVRLRAVNGFGGGLASTAVSVTPRGVPGAPTRVVASPRNGAAVVRFVASPANGAAVTNYQYSLNLGPWRSLSPADATSPIAIPGLRNGVLYGVRLRALNAAGAGAASTSVNVRPSATPVTPGAPTALVARPGPTGRTVTVSFWPGSDGGAAVTNQQYSLNGGAWTALSPADGSSPITLTGLRPGASYGIRLRSVNSKGAGAASGSVAVITPNVPTAPTLKSNQPANGQVTVSFSFSNPGGTALTGAQYSLDGGAWVPLSGVGFGPLGTSGSGTITGLVNGVSRSARVRVVNTVGAGAVSAPFNVVSATAPSAPTDLVATPGNGSITIAFTPGATGGLAPYNFQYSLDGGSWSWPSSPVTASPLVIAGLQNGRTYSVRIRAVNAVDVGAESAPVMATPISTPGAPTGVSTTSFLAFSGLSMRYFGVATWSTPVDTGGSPITAYVARWFDAPSDGNVVLTCQGLGNECTSTQPAVPGATYWLEVVAVNAVGEGTPSARAVWEVPMLVI